MNIKYHEVANAEALNALPFVPGSLYLVTDEYRLWLDPINGPVRVPLNSETRAMSVDDAVVHAVNGMNTTKLFNFWWPNRDVSKSHYYNLSKFFELMASAWDDKRYTLKWYQPSVSTSSVMTPMDDLVGKQPGSLLTDANSPSSKDWTEEDPMCWYVRGNALSLADGTMDILALEGEEDFDLTGETAPVYTFSMALFRKRWSDEQYKYISWATTAADGYTPYAGDVDPINAHRAMTWHATFCGGVTSDGKLTSGAGLKVKNFTSAANGNTLAKKWNNYEGLWNDCDTEWLLEMWQLRHFDLENSNILEGCTRYDYQYQVYAAETGVKRVLLTTAQAANIIVGSTVSVGDYSAGSKDRGQTTMRNLADLVVVESKETVDSSSVAINLQMDGTMDVPATAYISTMPWHSGSTEVVSGHCDGCRGNLTSGKYTARIAGVEVLNGAYCIGLDPLYQVTANGSNFDFAVHECKDSENLASTVTANYIDTGIRLTNVEYKWNYVKSLAENEDGIVFPAEFGGGETQYYKSAFRGTASAGVRCPWRFAFLYHCGAAGLACEAGDFSPGNSRWNGVPRLAGSGKKRGEWQA